MGELSSGGMGAVYLARQKGPGGFGRDVALKVMLPDLARNPALRPESAAAVADELAAIIWEAGGRFAHPEAAARHLESLGASLAGRRPERLARAPWFAEAARAAPPAPAVATADHPAGAPAVTTADHRAAGTTEPAGELEIVAPPDGTYQERALPE
ncbi:hypothetical protein [Sorangium sp. So ce513]|uniref:hypothetical protein n=1 Tax=Sorangium sp. So ce513 TaxID=3133315 RepID=UPI003F60D4DA